MRDWAWPPSDEERASYIDHIDLIPVDLDGDGRLDLLFLTRTSCGTLGCLIHIAHRARGPRRSPWQYLIFCDIVHVEEGVRVLSHKTNGFHDLLIDGDVFQFNKGQYCTDWRKP